jgi:hypothetical protein
MLENCVLGLHRHFLSLVTPAKAGIHAASQPALLVDRIGQMDASLRWHDEADGKSTGD